MPADALAGDRFTGDGALLAEQAARKMHLPLGVDGVAVHVGSVPEGCVVAACADRRPREIWIKSPRWTGRSRWTRFVLAHEYGHVWEHWVLTDEQRAWFARLGRFPPWTRGDGHTPGGEAMADLVAACALGLRPPAGRATARKPVTSFWITSTLEPPSPRRYLRLCNAIAILGLLAA